VFAGVPAAPDYLIASAIDDLYNFNVATGGDADAIIESIGDAGASKIVQMCSAEQLLVLTDRGPYYVPEGPDQPVPRIVDSFYPFGSPWPITTDRTGAGVRQRRDHGVGLADHQGAADRQRHRDVGCRRGVAAVAPPDRHPDRIAVTATSRRSGALRRDPQRRRHAGGAAAGRGPENPQLHAMDHQRRVSVGGLHLGDLYAAVSARSTATPSTFSNCSIRTITLDARRNTPPRRPWMRRLLRNMATPPSTS
jgi:hypothetical protein